MNLTPRLMTILQGVELFSTLSYEQLCGLVEASRGERYQAGEDILCEGEPSRRLGVLISGEAQVYKGAGESRVLMSILGPGSVIGAAALFLEDAAAATGIRAKRASAVMWTEEETLAALMREDFTFTRGYLAYLTSRIHFLTERIESIACTGAEEKLWSFLLRNAQEGEVRLPGGMGGLAEALGMSRASLYRVMDRLVSSGRIRRDGRNIYIN